MPHNIYELTSDSPFDAFASYDTSKWAKTETGDTTVTFSTPSTGGNVAFANAGSGTLGISELEGSQSWGRNSNIMVDITTNTMTPNAAGSVEANLVLYLDSDDYIKFGPYKDGAGTVDEIGYLRYNIAGGGEVAVATTGTATDTSKRTYSVGLTNDYLIFYIDASPYYRLKYDITNYVIKLTAGTTHDSDVCDIDFNDYVSVPEFSPLLMATLHQAILGGSVAGAQVLENEIGTPVTGGEVDLTDTSLTTVEFTTASHGSVFELTFCADLDKTTTGFDTIAPASTILEISIWRKINGAYPSLPQDIYAWQQGSVDRNLDIEKLRCISDTKIGFQLDTDPAPSTVEIPYSYAVEKKKD